MRKFIAIPLIVILAVGVGVFTYFYLQEANRLQDAQSEIAALEEDVSSLEGNVSSLEGNVSSLEARLSDSEATVSSLEVQLEGAQNALTAQQEANSVLAEEMKTMKDPRHFQSLAELTDWLYQDDADTRYAHVDLAHLAGILQVRALRDGYLLPMDWDVIAGRAYVGNSAVIGDSLYWVYADSDYTEWVAWVVPIPSHPLPED